MEVYTAIPLLNREASEPNSHIESIRSQSAKTLIKVLGLALALMIVVSIIISHALGGHEDSLVEMNPSVSAVTKEKADGVESGASINDLTISREENGLGFAEGTRGLRGHSAQTSTVIMIKETRRLQSVDELDVKSPFHASVDVLKNTIPEVENEIIEVLRRMEIDMEQVASMISKEMNVFERIFEGSLSAFEEMSTRAQKHFMTQVPGTSKRLDDTVPANVGRSQQDLSTL